MMINKQSWPMLFILLIFLIAGCKEHIKEPAVAGAFYPAEQNVLKDMVSGYLNNAQPANAEGRLIALISPHAGYVFSGQVAAYSYKNISGRKIKTVILIGPSHHKAFNGASVYTEGSMKTPLGNVKINERIAKSLINEKAGVIFDTTAYTKEHSLEVQLPFLQSTLTDFTIVPILMGSPTKESFNFLKDKLFEIMRQDESTIIIASTDLSHYYDYDTAVKMDSKITDAVQRMSVQDAEKLLMSGEAEMCGGFPVLLTMSVARLMGATNGVLYKYANSGDVTPEKNRVVGYAAMGLYKSGLSKEEREKLLTLARQTIVSYVTGLKVPSETIDDPRLFANAATFVTIKRNGMLRGCIGNLMAAQPLYQSVINNAISASSRDSRFPPMVKEELNDFEVEISVLSPFEPLTDVNKIEIGKHGLYLINGQNGGVLLPQVPLEFGWDRTAYLENLSEKAGLPKDAWKTSQLYYFTAEVFH